MPRKKVYESYRIDEHATHDEAKEKKRSRGDSWLDRRRQQRGKMPKPLPEDETPKERRKAMKRAEPERINPRLASDYIDSIIRRCK